MYKNTLFALLLTVAVATPAVADDLYNLDNTHTRVGFSVTHMVISSVKGDFTKYSGEFTLGDKGVLTHVEASIDVASVNTGVEKRDNHLRSADFFDAKKFPNITFISKKISASGNNYTVEGDLTIKDVTKSIVLTGELLGTVKDPWGNFRAGFHAEGNINRKDFNVSFHKALEAGGLVVSDEVKIILDVEGIRAKTAKSAVHNH